MKRMILMTLALSIMAVGSVSANDSAESRGPKKRGVVVTICADPIVNMIVGNHHHDCCHHHLHKHHHHGKFDRVYGHNHGSKHKIKGPRHGSSHKGDKRDNHRGNDGRARDRR